MKTYHLKWSKHIPNMESVFTSLFETGGLTDVTIMCIGGSLRAHRIILSTCSNYFLKLFLSVDTKRPIISLPEVHVSTMQSLLKFIYTGEVEAQEDQIEFLLQAAKMLEISGLTNDNEVRKEKDEEEQVQKEMVINYMKMIFEKFGIQKM